MGWEAEDTSGSGLTDNGGGLTLKHDQVLYIAEMTKELRGMASGAGLEFLSYLLAIAEEEARQASQGLRYPG